MSSNNLFSSDRANNRATVVFYTRLIDLPDLLRRDFAFKVIVPEQAPTPATESLDGGSDEQP